MPLVSCDAFGVADLLTRENCSLADIDTDSIFQNDPDWMAEDETLWPAKATFPADIQPDENPEVGKRKQCMEKQFHLLWDKLREDFFSARTKKNRRSKIKNLEKRNIVAVKELNERRGVWCNAKPKEKLRQET